MEGVAKSLRCSAAKHPVRNEQYVTRHCHGAIGSNFGAMAFPFIVLYLCSQDIRVVHLSLKSYRIISKVSEDNFEDFCFHFDNWPRFVGTRKHASVRSRDNQEHESVHTVYR
ncbi:hypothetical protein TNCV_3586651 [Trichonephila clavipes]|nr:hypothetical protein TNCV_3586651 [Trichonephila clavipes]